MIADTYADELVKWKAILPHKSVLEKMLNEHIGRLQTEVSQALKQPGMDSSISSTARMFAIAQLKSILGLFDFYESEIKQYLK